MALKLDAKNLDKVIIVGDRLLIKPVTPQERTKSGLYLPPGVQEKEKINQGYVMKVGPGYPVPAMNDADESWKQKEEGAYMPLQAKPGDLAVFLVSGSYELFFNDEKYYILPNSSVLMLVRDEGLFT